MRRSGVAKMRRGESDSEKGKEERYGGKERGRERTKTERMTGGGRNRGGEGPAERI